jgi:oxygen-independent coproporphyrinogen-3 oxidase
MAGIYFHIPFCKKACHYCNFYFSTNQKLQHNLVKALVAEIDLQKNFFNKSDDIETIYFGGGTPSLLSNTEVSLLLNAVYKNFSVKPDLEITFECNPDDLTYEKSKQLFDAGINRLSIGVQSFIDAHLVLMNRAHNSSQSLQSIAFAVAAGFTNISIDLMYALPGLTNNQWLQNVRTACELPITHLSCYNLTIEEKTALAKFVASGKTTLVDDSQAAEQFNLLVSTAAEYGFEQYEISNFARNRMYSKHNTAYWQSKPYLGIGPAAHSFKSNLRLSNIANTPQYIKAINKGTVPNQTETLTPNMLYNEFVLTRLRTCWGIDAAMIEHEFGNNNLQYFINQMQPAVDEGKVIIRDMHYTLTALGKLWADEVAANAFIVAPIL